MAPPSYSDVGKEARDIFTKGYNFNFVKLDCKTKSSGGVEFNVNGSSNLENGKVSAFLEGKYKIPEHGITLKHKWSSDNTLHSEYSMEEKFLKGSKLALTGTFAPTSGKKTGCLKTAYKAEYLHLNADADLDLKGPILHTSLVLGLKGWMACAHSIFNTGKQELDKCNFGLSYQKDDFSVHTHVKNGQEYEGFVYQKVNPNLETGIQVNWAGGLATYFGLGCVYTIDKDTSLRAKVGNNLHIGLGIAHRLREGIKLTLSTQIDARSFNQGGHKIGLGIELEA